VKTTATAVVTAVAALLLAACGSDDDSSADTTQVAASTAIIADIVEQVGGHDVEVEQVIPDGSSPHDFALSAKDRATIEDSDLFVLNGAGLEEGISADEFDVEKFDLAEHVGELLPFEEAGAHEHSEVEEEDEHDQTEDEHAESEEPAGEEEHEHGSEDPHVWMDPTRVAEAAPALADALAEADPDNADAYRDRADAFVKELTTLDSELEQEYSAIPEADRQLVTSHDALGYLADRYGFTVIATPFPASGPEAEPSAQAIAEVEEAISESGVPAVFAEETDDPEVLEQIADRTGVEIVDGLLVEAPGSAGSYIEMLRTDADLISQALAPAGGST
jgi:zinc/manganese transport system substrate-binding protein